MSGGHLEDHAGDAECIAFPRQYDVMVPIARDGGLFCLVNHRRVDGLPIAKPLPVEDFVVGLELLGFTFQLWVLREEAGEVALFGEPQETLPHAWDRHALRIMAAFGTGRRDEVVTFLRERA